MSELTLSKKRVRAQQERLSNRLLPAERLERVASWGEVSSSMSYVYRPSTIEALREVLSLAKQSGRTIGLRGGGNSYGDAAMNTENIVLDMRRMNRILDWDPETGQVRVEPGVTLSELWQYTLEDGWWPYIATGTSMTTMGGCAAMNVHGKNAWRVGTFGDHVLEFDFMLASGEIITCSREENSDVCLSPVVVTKMIQLMPERQTTLRFKRDDQNSKFTITVEGNIYNPGNAQYGNFSFIRISFLDTSLAQPLFGIINNGSNEKRIDDEGVSVQITRRELISATRFRVEREFTLHRNYKTAPFQVIIEEYERGPAHLPDLPPQYADRLEQSDQTDRLIYADVFKINEVDK